MAAKIDWRKFTEKQQKTIRLYVKTGLKRPSYAEAHDSLSVSGIKSGSARFFRRQDVKDIVDQIHKEAIRRANLRYEKAVNEKADDLVEEQVQNEMVQIDAQWVLHRAALLADFNIRKFLSADKHGNATYNFSEATDDDWYCIQEYTVKEIKRGKGGDVYYVDELKVVRGAVVKGGVYRVKITVLEVQ